MLVGVEKMALLIGAMKFPVVMAGNGKVVKIIRELQVSNDIVILFD